jgi:4-amino-4-deoxy-L-arabinose transferase-like glycosyltransferase
MANPNLSPRLSPGETQGAKKPDRFWLTAILAVAVLLRAAAAFWLGDRVVDLPGTFDQISYDMLAQRVLTGHGFTVAAAWWPLTPAGEPTAHWSFLYTLYLAGVYGLFGYHPLVARLIQAVLGGLLMPWLAYRLGRRHFSPSVGLVAAGLSALYAYFIYYAGTLMTETFYITVILWTLDLAGELGQASHEAPRSKLKIAWFLLGLALAVAVLLRQVFLLFVPILFVWLLWRSVRYQTQSVKQTIAGILIAAAVLALSIAPWTLRNYRAFGSFVLLNTNAGFAFFWANHPIHGYNFIALLPADGPGSYRELIPPELRQLNEAELDRALLKRALGFVQTDPGRYLLLSISRLEDYFYFWPSSSSGLISNVSRVLSFGILWPFMLFGFVYSLRRSLSSETLILYLFAVAYTAIHLLSWALIRYRLPVDAVLLVFAAFTLVKLLGKLVRRRANAGSTLSPTSASLRAEPSSRAQAEGPQAEGSAEPSKGAG